MKNNNCFTSKDLSKIKHNTNINYHGENYEFIARKINSPLRKVFSKINKENTQGLDYEASQKRYKAYQKLMRQVKKKCPSDYKKVYSRL